MDLDLDVTLTIKNVKFEQERDVGICAVVTIISCEVGNMKLNREDLIGLIGETDVLEMEIEYHVNNYC